MPQTHAQEHALSRHHAGRNPRMSGAPTKADEEGMSVSHASMQPDTASAASESGTVRRPRAAQAGSGTSHGAEHERHDPATESDLQHPQPAHHNDNEKSKLPERGDEGRKQAPHDRPGKKSGEGETPVG